MGLSCICSDFSTAILLRKRLSIVSFSAICEISEATCLDCCLLNFQLRSPGSPSPSPRPSGYPSKHLPPAPHLLLSSVSSSLSVEVQVEIRIQCQLYRHLMPSNPIWIELNLPKCPRRRGFDFSAPHFRDFLFRGD